MKLVKLTSLLVAGTVGLAACSDEATSPIASAAAPSLNEIVSSEAPRHLFNFSTTTIPADFESRVAAAGGTVEKAFGHMRIVSVRGLTPEAAAALGAAADISNWSPDVALSLGEPVEGMEPEGMGDAALTEAASVSNPAAASFYARQWHLRQIGADKAWTAGRLGSANVKVGILDTGLDYKHPDLAGHVDLSLSKSFVPKDNALIQQMFPGAHEVADLHYHGTHVGATVSSNGVAAAGVTSRVTLVGIKILDRSGNGDSFATLEAIEYAANIGLDVINMSLGIAQPLSRREYAWFNEMINRATNYAHSKGMTVVVSAGNENLNLDAIGNGFKAYCTATQVICISATGPTAQAGTNGPWTAPDSKASYSNYGRAFVDFAAPGGNGASRVTAACSTFSVVQPICRTGTYVLGINGTSMATPHVTGLAALLVEKYGRNPGAIRAALQRSSDDLGQPGNDPIYGQGRINVARALGL